MNHDEPQLSQPMHQPINDRRVPPTPPTPCAAHEQRIALTEQAVMSLKQTNEGITTKLDLLLAQMTKVALLEERNITQQQDLTRAHAKIEANAKTLDTLAIESRAFMAYAQGRDKVLWALGGVVLALLVKAMFFASSHGMTP